MMKRLLPICLIIAGLIFLIGPFLKNYLIASLAEKSYKNLTIQPAKNSTINQISSISDIDFVKETDVLKALISNTEDSGIGLLDIPSVGLKLPIFRETNNANLLKGAGMLNETFRGFDEGNILLAGHHMKKEGLLFQPLTKLKAGDSVYIMDQEKVYQYRMGEAFIVSEEDTSVLTQPFDGLTLITCDVPTPTAKRLIIQGKLVKVEDRQ